MVADTNGSKANVVLLYLCAAGGRADRVLGVNPEVGSTDLVLRQAQDEVSGTPGSK